MDAKKIGSCIKRNRNKHKLSLEELAEQTGISVDQLLLYEYGNKTSRFKELVAISEAIHVPLLMLAKGGGHPIVMYMNEKGKRVERQEDY